MRGKIKQLILFFVAFAILGYIREFFFVHINVIMYSKFYRHPPEPPLPQIMLYFERFTYETLYYSKYFYTSLFVAIYFLLNNFCIKNLTGSRQLVKILQYSYIIILVVAGLSMLIGFLGFQRLQNDEYTLSRWLMGIAQSPIICLILLASGQLIQKTNT